MKVKTKQKAPEQMSVWELLTYYKDNCGKFDVQETAEISFALAIALKRSVESDERLGPAFGEAASERRDSAREYARVCMSAMRALPSQTLKQVAPRHTVLAGVVMPNYIHLNAVQQNAEMRALLKDQ